MLDNSSLDTNLNFLINHILIRICQQKLWIKEGITIKARRRRSLTRLTVFSLVLHFFFIFSDLSLDLYSVFNQIQFFIQHLTLLFYSLKVIFKLLIQILVLFLNFEKLLFETLKLAYFQLQLFSYGCCIKKQSLNFFCTLLQLQFQQIVLFLN